MIAATDSINGTWSNYTYDDFDRLISSTCSAACPQGASTLGFSYSYDRYGNRWQQTLTAGTGTWPQPSYTFDTNNRISASSGFTFDAAGNITNDSSHTYTYDAENRIVQVDSGSTAVYGYDAEGRRVAKTASSAGGAFEYLYDLHGRAVTELGAGTSNINRTEVYSGSRHVATQNVGLSTTYFMHSDWLGTKRVASGLSGTAMQTCTSLVYGDSMTCAGPFASPLNFTGQMRDAETQLVEFPARYYSPTQGRWYSADWASAQVAVPYADLHNPQSLNLYDYVGSDPTNHADADGHECLSSTKGCDTSHADGQVQTAQGQAAAQTAQNTTQQQTQQTQQTQEPKKGFGILPTGTAAIDVGVGKAGATAQGSAAAGAFIDNKGHPAVGAEASGSVVAYAGQHTAGSPKQDKDSFVVGAFAGVGGGVTLTNAGNAPAMKTMTNTLNIDIGLGPAASISISSGHAGISSVTITLGFGCCLAVTETNTGTATAPLQ